MIFSMLTQGGRFGMISVLCAAMIFRVSDAGELPDWTPPPPPKTPDEQLDDYARALRRQLMQRHGLPEGLFLAGADQARTLTAFEFEFHHGANASMISKELVPVESRDFSQALRVEVGETGRLDWSMLLKHNGLADAIREGDRLLLSFWARCLEAETGGGYAQMDVRRRWPPLTRCTVAPGAEWRHYLVPFEAPSDADAAAAAIQLNVAAQRQTMEFGGIVLINYGQEASAPALADLPSRGDPETYPGMEDPDDIEWRRDARRRIERHRKADLPIRVVDAEGNPVPDATVRVRMTSHQFHWGNGSDLGYFGGRLWEQMAPRYLNLGTEGFSMKGGTGMSFNQAGFGIHHKWNRVESAREGEGGIEDSHTFRAMRWLRENGIALVRGHTLMWGDLQSVPRRVQDEYNRLGGPRSPEAREYFLNEVREHVRQTVADYKGWVFEWDVVNEFLHRLHFEQMLGYDGMVEEVAQWFKIAAAADPEGKWWVNDNRMLNRGGRMTLAPRWVYQFTKDLIEAGAPVHGVGLQGHLGFPLADPRRVYEVLDKFTDLGVELKVTELDIGRGVSEMEVARAGITGDPEVDSDLAALYLRDFLTVCFSHPSVSGVQMWGMWDQTHWKGNALLYTPAWRLKPTGRVYLDLVFNQWWTDETLTTDQQGNGWLRAFKGDYRITVRHEHGESTVELTLAEDRDEPLKIRLP